MNWSALIYNDEWKDLNNQGSFVVESSLDTSYELEIG